MDDEAPEPGTVAGTKEVPERGALESSKQLGLDQSPVVSRGLQDGLHIPPAEASDGCGCQSLLSAKMNPNYHISERGWNPTSAGRPGPSLAVAS